MDFDLNRRQKMGLCIEARNNLRQGNPNTGLCYAFSTAFIALGYGWIDNDEEALELLYYMGFKKPNNNTTWWWPLDDYHKGTRIIELNNVLVKIIDSNE